MIPIPLISTPAPEGDAPWDHLLKPGRYPGTGKKPDGKEIPVIQIVTPELITQIATALNRKASDADWTGLLLDVEHASLGNDGSTAAAAWYREFDVRPDGLWGKAERTSLGSQLISGKVYKRLSPVADLEPVPNRKDEYYVTGLNSVGLTNKANMPALRILAANREPIDFTPTQKESTMLKPETLKALGLAEDADAEAIDAAITALAAKAARADELEAANSDREAEEFGEKEKDKFKGGKDAAKSLYAANKAAAIAVVENAVVATGSADAATKVRVLNREDTRTPKSPVTTGVGTPDDDKRAIRVRNRALEIQKTAGIGFQAAWARAENEVETNS